MLSCGIYWLPGNINMFCNFGDNQVCVSNVSCSP